LTPDSIRQKYAQMVASTWITPACVQFLENKKRFHTAWTLSRPRKPVVNFGWIGATTAFGYRFVDPRS
jgi:hypothetical protein